MLDPAAELGDRIAKSIDMMPTPEIEEQFLPHMEWLLRQIMAHVKPKDLKASELIALLAILVPAHSRVLVAGRLPPIRPVLTILR